MPARPRVRRCVFVGDCALSRLQQSFAANHLLPLSSLIERSAAQIARARQTVCTSRKCAKGGRLTNNSYRGSGGLLEVHSVKKIWLWALPSTRFPIACYLDLDVLITSNLDALIEGPTSFELAAVQAVGCSSGLNVFNAALLVFRPSLSRLESLLRRERSYERVGQACENAITDQSVLNAEFRGCRDYPLVDMRQCMEEAAALVQSQCCRVYDDAGGELGGS